MPRRLHNWSFQQVVDVLKENGFEFIRSRGSHFTYAKSNGKIPAEHIVTVPFHASTPIHPSTLKSIILQSGIPKNKWLQ